MEESQANLRLNLHMLIDNFFASPIADGSYGCDYWLGLEEGDQQSPNRTEFY